MSSVETSSRSWVNLASDRCNAILVKETRQALKSKQFVATFMLMLICAWLISAFLMLWSGDAIEFGAVAMQFFYSYYFVLAVAIFIIVPYLAYRSLLNESELDTFDLLSITTLSPRQIVWGKLLSAIVQMFVYYSAIAPFVAFTALLNGFDSLRFAFLLVTSLLVSVAASMVALMLGAFARRKHWQIVTSLVLIGALVMLFMMMFFGMAPGILFFRMPFDEPEFWWAIAAVVTLLVSYLVLIQQITTVQLTFESDNRSSGIRVTAAVQLWLYAVCLISYFHWSGTPLSKGDAMVMSIPPLIHLFLVSFFLVTEPDALSRRIRRGLPRSKLVRTLMAPFMPGGSRGMVYAVVNAVGAWVVISVVMQELPQRFRFIGRSVNFMGFVMAPPMPTIALICCYAIIFLCLASALARWGRAISPDITAIHARVAAMMMLAGGFIVPWIPRWLEWVPMRGGFYFLDVTFPPFAQIAVARGGDDATLALTLLVVVMVVGLVVNSRAMVVGVLDILRSNVVPRRVDQELVEESAVGGLVADAEASA